MIDNFDIRDAPYIVPLFIWLSTGILKFVIACLIKRELTFKHIGSGGFPSNHAAIIFGTTIYIGLTYGFSEPVFALGIALSAIVIFDAAGLRREVGRHSFYLNDLKGTSEFRERTGHKLHEILGGVVWGMVVAYLLS